MLNLIPAPRGWLAYWFIAFGTLALFSIGLYHTTLVVKLTCSFLVVCLILREWQLHLTRSHPSAIVRLYQFDGELWIETAQGETHRVRHFSHTGFLPYLYMVRFVSASGRRFWLVASCDMLEKEQARILRVQLVQAAKQPL